MLSKKQLTFNGPDTTILNRDKYLDRKRGLIMKHNPSPDEAKAEVYAAVTNTADALTGVANEVYQRFKILWDEMLRREQAKQLELMKSATRAALIAPSSKLVEPVNEHQLKQAAHKITQEAEKLLKVNENAKDAKATLAQRTAAILNEEQITTPTISRRK